MAEYSKQSFAASAGIKKGDLYFFSGIMEAVRENDNVKREGRRNNLRLALHIDNISQVY